MGDETGGAGRASPATVTPVDLFAFRRGSGPSVRAKEDFRLDSAEAEVPPGEPPLPLGASTFSDLRSCPLTGVYFLLPKGTSLPDGLAVIRDDEEAVPGSTQPAGHYSIYATRAMLFAEFDAKFRGLPWLEAGKKKV